MLDLTLNPSVIGNDSSHLICPLLSIVNLCQYDLKSFKVGCILSKKNFLRKESRHLDPSIEKLHQLRPIWVCRLHCNPSVVFLKKTNDVGVLNWRLAEIMIYLSVFLCLNAKVHQSWTKKRNFHGKHFTSKSDKEFAWIIFRSIFLFSWIFPCFFLSFSFFFLFFFFWLMEWWLSYPLLHIKSNP